MYLDEVEFDEEDGVGLVCVILSEGQLDGITATVALSTSDETATSPSGNKKFWGSCYPLLSLSQVTM